MPDRLNDYTAEDLRQAARESRAWAALSRAHAEVHAVTARTLEGEPRRVAHVFADVARENAEHAERMAARYEKAVE